ncbi:MAG: beta-galactosidase [Defluviitaleaceae bacterium]|nr:beta-galactosidase [Defluviitaleaceae bacterium]
MQKLDWNTAAPIGCTVTSLGNEGYRIHANECGGKLAFDVPCDVEPTFFLNFDITYEGENSMCFSVEFYGQSPEPLFMSIGLLPGIRTQVSMPIAALDSQRIFLRATPGKLKTTLGGKPIDVKELTKISLCMDKIPTPSSVIVQNLCISPTEQPYEIPDTKLCDEIGQAIHKTWHGKTASAEEMVAYLRAEKAKYNLPENQTQRSDLNQYGGWLNKPLGEGTGYFHVVKEGDRYWLADPQGYAFISAGLDCIGPDSHGRTEGIEKFYTWLPAQDDPTFADAWNTRMRPVRHGRMFSHATSNLIRAFGDTWFEDWAHITKSRLREWGINTIANWSSPRFIESAKMPYVWPLRDFPQTAMSIFRDFPDVFSDEYAANSKTFASQIEPMKDDPYLIGYFLSNEPHWAFGNSLNIAEELLASRHDSATKDAFINFLQKKYQSISNLNKAWGTGFSGYDELKNPIRNARTLSTAANDDISVFSKEMVRKYISVPSLALRAIDPNHLNLGIRYAWFSGEALLGGIEHFDVFSFNCYANDPTSALDAFAKAVDLPLMIGEYHHGALDVGLWATGIGATTTQEQRGKAYRRYTENAIAFNKCVGAHYFILNDQPLLGRFDGENYQIGFVDVCHKPYDDFVSAVKQTTDCMYDVATAKQPPYGHKDDEMPEYATKIYY